MILCAKYGLCKQTLDSIILWPLNYVHLITVRTTVRMEFKFEFELNKYRERKCADTIGTVPVPWAGNFQC